MSAPTESRPGEDAAGFASVEGEDVVLKDGRTIRLRSLTAADRQKAQVFFERLSPRSSRYRFFGTKTFLPSREIDRVTTHEKAAATAFGAIVDPDGKEELVGIAELAPLTRASDTRRAEFAIAVADDYQDRGIGTLLLEWTALAAQQAGIDEIEAVVLADNVRMLDVFKQSGFELKETTDGIECKVVFPTARTEHFLAASAERERMAARESVRVFFEPSSVAVVGVSHKEGGIGRAIVENIVSARYSGRIYPVGPNVKNVYGLDCYPSLGAIGRPVDLVVIAVPAVRVEDVIAESAHAHARGVVVVSSGFGETSAEGRAREARIRHLARNAGMRLIGPNCMGVLNRAPEVRLNATFSPVWPPPGNVSMLSQSGALGIAMLDHAARLNLGLSGFVSVGNKADVSANDLLSYWAYDPHTKVIALYLESFGNARKFARLAPEVARRKPIVAVKSGRSAAGTRAAASHSAALASLDVGIDALFAHAGVIRTNTLEELFDVVALLSTQPPPKGPRVGVVTNAGGPGILLADACEARGLTLPSLSPKTLDELRGLLPAQAGLANPVDVIAAASPEQMEKAIALVGQDPAIDSVVAIYIPLLVTKPEDAARAIARGAALVPADKPVATVFMSSKGAPEVLGQGPRGKIPSYSFPENVALALPAAHRRARFAARQPGNIATIAQQAAHEIRRIVDVASASAPNATTWLAQDDVARVLALAGIRYVESVTAPPDPEAAARASKGLGYPVVLKAVARGLVHKSDASAVVLDLASSDAVREAATTVKAKVEAAGFPVERFLLQPYVAAGFEALVGVTTDHELGHIVVAGLGGVQVELFGDAAFRLPPVSDLDAREMVDGLKSKRLFDGFRGAPPGDRRALEDVICKISALVDIVPEIVDLDLNPIKVLPPGKGAIAVDARIRVRKP